MKILSKILPFVTAIILLTPEVSAAPVQMTLTYDGKQHQYNAESIDLNVNGNPIELTLMPPVILEGRTFVPAREVFEPLGAFVEWKDNTKELYIGYNGSLIIMKAGAETADVNGTIVTLEVPAKIINDKLMIPARFVAEQLEIPVNWDANNRIVSIGTVPEPAEDSTEELYNNQAEESPSEQPEPPAPETPAIPAIPADVSASSVDISTEPLTEISGSPVNITSFASLNGDFTITASGPISKAQKQLLPENKLVIDIYNAVNSLESNSYPSSGYSGVTAVRNSQFQTEPDKITRFVFDMTGANKFSVAFGPDRKSIIVTYEQNTVTNVTHSIPGINETITISAALTPTVEASRMFSPDKLILDVPGAKYSQGMTDNPVDSRFVQKFSVQAEEGRVRIIVDLKENMQYKITYEGNAAVISLSEPTYKNIKYAQLPETSITLTGAEGLIASQVSHKDDYLNNRYSITLPLDYTSNFGYGAFEINDSIINSITIQNTNGKTELVISQKNITAYVVENNGADLVIKPKNPKAVYKNVVYLDAGHGFSDPGAMAGGFQEKNLNLNIMLRLYELLENDAEIKVYASRLEDTYPENADRAYTANPIADMFISIHHNAAENSKSNGTEVLYFNHEGEVYPKISSEALARIIQTNLSRDIDTLDRGVIKRPGLIVLNQTTIPAVIVEVVFMTNSADLAKVSTPEGRQKVADSVYRSIKEAFRQYPTGR